MSHIDQPCILIKRHNYLNKYVLLKALYVFTTLFLFLSVPSALALLAVV